MAAAGLVAIACVVSAVLWSQPIRWTPDGYFYRAMTLRVLGAPEAEALRAVFEGSLTAADRQQEADLEPYGRRRLSDPEWVRESAPFYERRWTVPLLAAPLDSTFGARGLRLVSLAGYVLLAPLLYVLLRLWFPLRIALPAALVAMSVEPLRVFSSLPLTDSWGLALATAALAFGCLTVERDPRWLAAWAPTILVLSFTRDLTLVVVGAAILTFLLHRTRVAGALASAGVLAALPAPLLYGAPLKALTAYILNDYYPVDRPTWSFIADRYLGGVQAVVSSDLSYLVDRPFTALVLVGGSVAILLLRPAGPARTLVWSMTPAVLGYALLAPNYTYFRLELAVLPVAALGLCAGAAWLKAISDRRRGAQETDRPAAPPRNPEEGR